MTLGDRLRKATEETPRTWELRPVILCGSQIPKPLHGLCPRSILGAAWWRKTRAEAIAKTEGHCIACGVHRTNARFHKWLEGHEVYDIDYLAGLSTYVETVPLCHLCHNYIHAGRLQALLNKRIITHSKFIAVIQHGDDVLQQVGLVKRVYDGPSADWKTWRLLLNGKKYKPLYKTMQDWIRAHNAEDR